MEIAGLIEFKSHGDSTKPKNKGKCGEKGKDNSNKLFNLKSKDEKADQGTKTDPGKKKKKNH